MERRQASAAATRRRILEATRALHREQGIPATTLQDVAHRADVALGTVYRHFPNLEALVTACGEEALGALRLPSADDVVGLFGDARSPEEAVERLAAEIARLYSSGAIVFARVREGRDFLPVVRDADRRLERLLDVLVHEAVRPLRLPATQVAVVRALVDVRVWEALRDRLPTRATARALRDLLLSAATAPRGRPVERTES